MWCADSRRIGTNSSSYECSGLGFVLLVAIVSANVAATPSNRWFGGTADFSALCRQGDLPARRCRTPSLPTDRLTKSPPTRLGGEIVGVGRASGISDQHSGHCTTVPVRSPSPGNIAGGSCGISDARRSRVFQASGVRRGRSRRTFDYCDGADSPIVSVLSAWRNPCGAVSRVIDVGRDVADQGVENRRIGQRGK